MEEEEINIFKIENIDDKTKIQERLLHDKKLLERFINFSKEKNDKKLIKQINKVISYHFKLKFKDYNTQILNENIFLSKTIKIIEKFKEILLSNVQHIHYIDYRYIEYSNEKDIIEIINKIFQPILKFFDENKDNLLTLDILAKFNDLLHTFNNNIKKINFKNNILIKNLTKKTDYKNFMKYFLICLSTYRDLTNFIDYTNAEIKGNFSPLLNIYNPELIFKSDNSSSSSVLISSKKELMKDIFEEAGSYYKRYTNYKTLIKKFETNKYLNKIKKTLGLFKKLLINNITLFKYGEIKDISKYNGQGNYHYKKLVKRTPFIIEKLVKPNHETDDLSSSSSNEYIKKFITNDIIYSDLDENIINIVFYDIINYISSLNDINNSILLILYDKLFVFNACFNQSLRTHINIDKYKENLKIGEFKNGYKDYKNFIRYISILNKIEQFIRVFADNKKPLNFNMSEMSSTNSDNDSINNSSKLSSSISLKSSQNEYNSFKKNEPINIDIVRNVKKYKLFKKIKDIRPQQQTLKQALKSASRRAA